MDTSEKNVETFKTTLTRTLMKNYIINKHFVYPEIQNMYETCVFKYYPSLEKNLNEQEAELIHSILSGNDTIGILTPEFEKRRIQLAPSIFVSKSQGITSTTIIVSTLESLIVSTLSQFEKYGVMVKHCKKALDFKKLQLVEGSPNYILTSPDILSKKDICAWMKANPIDFMYIDEGQLMSEWDDDFRDCYSEIKVLRSFSLAPLTLFTGPVTTEMLTKIKSKVSCFRESALTVVGMVSRRSNVYLDLRPKANEFKCLQFLVDNLKAEGSEVEKTIIYVQTPHQCTEMFMFFLMKLGKNFYVLNDKQQETGFRVNFVSNASHEETKEDIKKNFAKENSTTRVLISTVEFAMDLEFQAVDNVIMYGLNLDIAELWQCIGRAGINNKPSKAILIPIGYFERDEEGKLPHEAELFPGDFYKHCIKKVVIPEGNCIRAYILGQYGTLLSTEATSTESDSIGCCSYCLNLKKL